MIELKRYSAILVALILFLQIPVASIAGGRFKPTIDFADTMRIEGVVNILRDELTKAGFAEIPIADLKWDGSGKGQVVLALRSTLADLKIPFGTALAKMGPEACQVFNYRGNVIITGNSVLALRHGVFFYLEKLGFRYFLPGEDWSIVPRRPNLFQAVNLIGEPDYEYRRFANGHGYNKNKILEERFNFWHIANRLGGAFDVTINHTYQVIVANNRDVFMKHPEYFAGQVEKGQIPANPKFNVGNPELVELIKRDAIKRIEAVKNRRLPIEMISMEPSDGGGYCEKPECKALGTVSDQVYFLANEVAKHIRREYPGIWVGVLAYNQHIVPTRFSLSPNMFVMVTNGFNRSKYSTRELLRLWGKKVRKIGVYEYLSVYEWDNDLPGRPLATQIDYLKTSIRNYYQDGARSYLGETTIGWVNKGLGQYVASRLLWNTRSNIDSIISDFYSMCFEKAASPMRKLFSALENAPRGYLSDNDLAKWIDLVKEADRLSISVKVKKRILYVKEYLHYLVLYKRLKSFPSAEAMHEVLAYANRTFTNASFATLPAMISLPRYSGFPSMGLVAGREQRWQSHTIPPNAQEIDNWLIEDRQSLQTVNGLKVFQEADYFRLVRPDEAAKQRSPDNPFRTFVGSTKFLLRVSERSALNHLVIKSGFSARPAQDQPVTIKVYSYSQYRKIKSESDVIIADTQWSSKVVKQVSLGSLSPGNYLLEVEDYLKIFSIGFSGKIQVNTILSEEKIIETNSSGGLNTFYFYAPASVSNFIVHKSKVLQLRSPAGRVIDLRDNSSRSEVVEVKKNEVGVWMIYGQAGGIHIEGIPPYLSMDPSKLLIPVYSGAVK